ncbi:hypothetical protein MAR_012040 [Mya arenaria]|uniref:Uncharacterized protein n=1 Tax=Mya arenaria TaxID=6604 RepID=A0ABY7G4X2_MYAAR|nr:uncharacterized protein LOC128218511 isoform X2 [Mya arenaria]WAR26336.1 hypothetical protein MAR_012040 [Mya arenaria]
MDDLGPDIRECFRLYGQYKFCQDGTCIHANDTCHITTEAVRTGSGAGISMAVVVTISSLCVCLAVAAMFVVFFARRTGSHRTKESNSATEPLRKCYISESSDSRDDSDRFPARAKTYYRKCESSGEISSGYFIYNPEPERNDFVATENENHQAFNVFKRNSDDNGIQKENFIWENAEINDPDRNELSPELIGLGKYTFKPRLKYTNCNEILFTDKHEKDKLYVINSYKHCSGKSINPGNLTFDTDPKKFSCKFANDVLCSSTPRQGSKHMSLPTMNTPSIDSLITDVNV